MCLLVVSFAFEAGLRLVVAANRDERYERPASAVARRPGTPRVLAGRDEEAGGTWLAVNEHGVVAGLTNQPAPGGRDPTRRTRGELPLLLVRGADARAAVAEFCSQVDPARYNPCSLLVGDGRALFSLELTGAAPVRAEELAPGRHVLENRPFGTPSAKTALVERRLEALPRDLGEDRLAAALGGLLADHAVPEALPGEPPDARGAARLPACVHTDGYGTRSSTVVVVPDAPAQRPTVLAADGPPCVTAFRDVSALWG